MLYINFGIKDAIDVLLVAYLLFQIYLVMKKSGTTAIFGGVLAFFVIWILISQVLEMRLLGTILDQFVRVGVILIVILFQDEIKRFLQAFGLHKGWKYFTRFFKPRTDSTEDASYIMPIVLSSMNMAKSKTGALIVIQQDINLDVYVKTGEVLNANISSRLIENIFFKNTPLHDGAMIIVGKKIRAAGCILPVSQRTDIPQSFGLRHRSALGLSQETDAKIIVVSEETGKITLAHEGEFSINITADELQKALISH